MYIKGITIISGGQTGVDRAALDSALAKEIPCRGWCQKGRLAEDGIIDLKYPLQETESEDPAVRTEKNVIDSDGTLIIHAGNLDQGTAVTIRSCIIHNKPMHEVDLTVLYNTEHVIKWIRDHKIEKLNVSGPRESNAEGIYEAAAEFMNRLLKLYPGQGR